LTPWFDHCRRAASVLLVVLFLLVVPAVANAQFTSSKPSTLSLGTDTMETPTAITGSYSCTVFGSTEHISVTISTFTDLGPTGSTYGFSLAIGSTVKDSVSSTVKRQTLTGSRSYDGLATTWTIGIQGFLKGWSSAIGTKSITCPSRTNQSGTF
jgi:hypothetical protein